MSSQQETFDPTNVPRAKDMAQRRRYIEQYIQHFHMELLPEMALAREEAIFFICRMYHNERGKIEVPVVYFEYSVDKTLWRNIFLDMGQHAPTWPWKNELDPQDMSAGMSTVYREWRIERGFPVTMPHEADQQRARDLELRLANAQQEIERLNLHLQDVKTFHQESKEDMQGRLNDKDALLRSKDQEIQRLRMEGSNSWVSRQDHRTSRLEEQLAITQTEVEIYRQKLATANSRITQLEKGLTENPTKVQALETELAQANRRASNAEDNSKYFEGQLRDANTQLAGIQGQGQLPGQGSGPSIRVPEGPLGELAGMYALLAREVTDLPILPQGFASFVVETVAVEVAPMLYRVCAKGNLRSFLASGPRGWHCLETIVDGDPNPKGMKGHTCLDHKRDCLHVRVVNGEDGALLDFGGSESCEQ
ncbi:hypothetical protein F52700_2493 [Fusarium sp. NRRL 52700]|nr:hypothetical protein F52700_2493 [Fusarium sp. NRRL 52700]